MKHKCLFDFLDGDISIEQGCKVREVQTIGLM